MGWLKDLIQNNPRTAISFPIISTTLSFFGNLVAALADGQLDTAELHQLLSSTNAIGSVFLIAIFIALKEKKK